MSNALTQTCLLRGLLAAVVAWVSLHAWADGMPASTALPAPGERVLTGFDGLRFGASQRDILANLSKRDALQFEVARMVAGEEVRYRTIIGDLPFNVFLQFDPQAGWRRATVQLAGHTFGQTPQRCAALHERVVYLVSVEHGSPDQRMGPSGRLLPPTFAQRADFKFVNPATVTVHNRFDADTCYNHVVYDASPQRPVPSTF